MNSGEAHAECVDYFRFYRHILKMCRFFRVSSTYPTDMSMVWTCIENGIFLSRPNHIEDKLDMVCAHRQCHNAPLNA